MGSQEFLNICKTKVAEYHNLKKDKNRCRRSYDSR